MYIFSNKLFSLCDYCFTLQLSYSSTSEELSLRSDFPTFFRTVPSDNSLTAGIAGFIATYPKWTRVIVLTQDTEQYKLVSVTIGVSCYSLFVKP